MSDLRGVAGPSRIPLRLWFQLGCTAVALTSVASAQDAPLTLSDCVQKALDARNELSIARNDLRVA